MYQVNVQGTRHVLAACQAANVKVLVYTSSMEVVSGVLEDGTLQYGGSEHDDYPKTYLLPYAATKSQAEQLVLAANSSLRTVVLRPGYILGPGCIGVKMEIVRAFRRSKPVYVTAKVPACISCIHVQNCATAHVLAAEQAADVHGQALFIRDFNANPVDVAVSAFEGSVIQCIILPFWLAYAMAWMMDRVDRWLHWICGILGTTWTTSDSVIDIHAVDLGYHNIIVSSDRAREKLGYGDPVRGPKLIGKEQCFQDTKEWAHEFIRKQQERSKDE
jgi:hypothetical protein